MLYTKMREGKAAKETILSFKVAILRAFRM